MPRYNPISDSIKVGDVVCLKSDKNGLMTVNSLLAFVNEIECIWFNHKGDLQKENISVAALFIVID